MTLIIVFTQRVERLAKLQMNFVAGVSHELRTPLAVISSAADNLADGVVESAEPVKEYGELIRDEAHRLGAMVEQILRFAADKPGRQLELRPIEISGAVATALVDCAPMIEKAGTTVEMSIESGLPHALADQRGLQQCLLNLIGNAVKYGGDKRWLGIHACRGVRESAPEVQITVEDKGLGIEPDEMRQIFQPFYRGTAATAVRTHGTGLGLSLTSSVAEAMGGKITLESTPGRGSAFTLHLPVAEA
jgi:signal transduction histidine kinase